MRTTLVVVLLLGMFLAVSAFAAPRANRAPVSEWAEEVFVDYSHAGLGPHPTEESDGYRLTQGGIFWPEDTVEVEYAIVGSEPTSGGDTAIVTAEETWDGYITTRIFSRNDATASTNPCTSSPNNVTWGTIDGEGGALASASVCRNVVTKEIAGFAITIDTAETWSAEGGPGSYFDVENVLSHEWGHVAGLDHQNAPKHGCLSMYFLASKNETQKRTLGLGDKLGMNALYGSADVTEGSCGS